MDDTNVFDRRPGNGRRCLWADGTVKAEIERRGRGRAGAVRGANAKPGRNHQGGRGPARQIRRHGVQRGCSAAGSRRVPAERRLRQRGNHQSTGAGSQSQEPASLDAVGRADYAARGRKRPRQGGAAFEIGKGFQPGAREPRHQAEHRNIGCPMGGGQEVHAG